MKSENKMTSPVLICGGGLVGSVMALALAKFNIKSILIDKQSQEDIVAPSQDSRTTAINYGSTQIFKNLGLWDDLKPKSEPILKIKVVEGKGPWGIYYDYKDVGPDPMGSIVYNHDLKKVLLDHVLNNENITWIGQTDICDFNNSVNSVDVTLTTGQKIQSELLICAQGRNASLRDQMNIKTKSWDYEQSAIVCHMFHTIAHNSVAWEIFLSDGPLAFLPLSDKNNRHRSGLVWSLPPDKAKYLYECGAQEFEKTLLQEFAHLGDLNLDGQRWIYPLSALKSETVTANRFALIGDAAHVIHPVAGQGVNLGWRDCAVLAQVLYKAKDLGLDLGAYHTLVNYENVARKNHHALLLSTDILIKLFSNQSTPLAFLRSKGLGGVNQIGPLKRYLMRQAMGLGGKVPFLMGGTL